MVMTIKTIYKSRFLGGLRDFARGTMKPITRPVRSKAYSAPVPKRQVAVKPVPFGWDKLDIVVPAPVATEPEPLKVEVVEPVIIELPTQDAPSREDLVAEAKALGIKGINARWKLETLQAKIDEAKSLTV